MAFSMAMAQDQIDMKTRMPITIFTMMSARMNR